MAIAGAFWLSANKPDLLIQWEFLKFSIPVAYVNLVVAMLFFGALISMVNFFVLNEFIRIAANKLFKFGSAWVLTLLQDGSNAWSLGSVTQFRFLSSSKAHKVFGTFSAGMVSVPFVVALAIIYWTVLSVGFTVLRKEGLVSMGGAFTFLSWGLATFPLAYIAVIAFPFRFETNTDFIRWNFLTRLYRRSGLWPPSAGYWLK
jgi:hypothetical protein